MNKHHPPNNAGPEACVLEFNSDGHHLAYVEIVIRYLWEMTGRKARFFTSAKVPESKGYEIYLKSIQEKFEIRAAENISAGKGGRMWRQFFPILSLLKKIKREGVKRVYVPTGDEFAAILGAARSLGLGPKGLEIRCGLLLLPLAYPTNSWLRRLKRRFILWLQRRSGAALLCFDAHAVGILREKFKISLDVLPDPMLSLGASAARESRVSKEALCLGSIGFFDRRKGVDLLLEAFQKARFERPVQLLLAGKVNDPLLAQKLEGIGTRQGNKVQVIDKILTSEEYSEALGNMDILCLTYRAHVGSSGVYAQAASQGKVIVASDYGWLGWEGKNYNKIVFFKDQSLDSLTERLEQTVSKFDALNEPNGNYRPTTEADFTKVFCAP